ncbi:MAG: hypothetical protein HS103_06085 [Anaerolineales bacterium]|nr:hypothetical protein [Anaerolineales bacterium]
MACYRQHRLCHRVWGIIDAGLNTFLAAHYHPSLLYLLHAFFGVGTTLSPLFITDILRREESWRLAYQLVGGAAFVLAVIFLLTSPLWDRFERQPAKTKADASAVPVARTALFATLRLPMTWLGIVLFHLCRCGRDGGGMGIFGVYRTRGE